MLHKLLSEDSFTQDVTADFSHGLPQCCCARCLVPTCVAESWRAIRQQGFGGCMRTIYQDMDTSTQRSSEQLVGQLGGLCSSTRTSEWNLSLLSTTWPLLLLCSRAPKEEGTIPHHTAMSHQSCLCLTPAPDNTSQLIRELTAPEKNPGSYPVPGRMVTRQSFLGLRAGVSPADRQAFLTLHSLFLFTLCWYLLASLSLSSPSFAFAL